MIDDTKSGNQLGGSADGELVAEVLELLQFRDDRNDAYAWVKDLKLLAIDGDDSVSHPEQATGCALCSYPPSQKIEAASASKEPPLWACDECGKQQRLQERFHCSSCNGGNFDLCGSCVSDGVRCKIASHLLSRTGPMCKHLASNSCQQCILTQPFPGSGRVESFRIVRQSWLPRGKEPCAHYVAVSYCWPSKEKDQSEGRYAIRDVDGKIRYNRAPRDVIDRAVNFARESCCRFIWIDQECIEQDDSKEKSLAIQSMDLVYSRAQRSIALLDSILEPMIQLPAMSALYEWGHLREKTRNLIGSDLELRVWSQSEQIISFLDAVSHERWSTRAWVLQEALSAGENMFLLFKKPDNCESTRYAFSRLDLSLSEIAINMDVFARCLYWAKELFTTRPPQYATCLTPSTGDYVQQNKDRIRDLFEGLETQFVYPIQARGHFSRFKLGSPKRSCNAATALSFLRHRNNTVVSDRASIFANLCDYDYRLNMVKVEKRNYPLSTSLVALAILNGDYSLFIPEVYDSFSISNVHGIPLQLLPSRTQLRQIQYFSPNSPVLVPAQVKHHFSVLQDHSIAFPGFLWNVDSSIDLAWLQERHGAAWSLNLFYNSYFQRVENEGQSMGDFLRPYVEFFTTERPASFDELRLLVNQLSVAAPISWLPPYDRRALRIEIFSLHCRILLDLILFLRSNNELGLADAIWNSTQGAHWPIDDRFMDDGDVPASVRDFPETLPDNLDVTTLFELERDKRGDWLQSWMTWRIMTRGKVWYGHLIETSSNTNATAIQHGKPKSEMLEDGLKDPRSSPSIIQDDTELAISRSSTSRARSHQEDEQSSVEPSAASQRQADDVRKGRYFSQMVMSILTHKANTLLLEEAGHKTDRNLFHDDPGSYILLAQLASAGPEGESKVRERRAFFDVDEPCLVLTPFNTNMEVLPRPETRAMSVSWVVKCPKAMKPLILEAGGRVPVVESFTFVKAVRGMWAVGHHAATRYAVSCVAEDAKS